MSKPLMAWLIFSAVTVVTVQFGYADAIPRENAPSVDVQWDGEEPTRIAAAAGQSPESTVPQGEETSDPVIGTVKTLKGAAYVVRGGESLDAAIGMRLFSKDTLKTNAGASLGVVLRDDTTFSLGPESEMALTDFEFQPKDNEYSLVTDLVQGTFVYVSGLISKFAPDSVKMDTPVGIIAVRGTKLLVKIGG